MDVTVQVALIAAAASIIVAVLAHVWTKRQERADQLRQRKLAHYGELLSAISALADKGHDQEDARRRFATAANTIALVAPAEVINAVMAFHDSVSDNPKRSQLDADQLLKDLIVKLRRSLELPFDEEPGDFQFHLVGTHVSEQ